MKTLLLLSLLPSLAFGQVLRRDGGNGTFGVDVLAPSFTATVASGNNGLACQQNGCRVDFGAGASDYASSDGTTVTFAGPIGATSLTTSAASGAVAFAASTGALLDLGSGSYDSLASDGTGIVAAGRLCVSGSSNYCWGTENGTMRLSAGMALQTDILQGRNATTGGISFVTYATVTAALSAFRFSAVNGAAGALTTGYLAQFRNNGVDMFQLDYKGMPQFGIANTDAAPTCDATQRNKLWVIDGGTGVTDTVSICLKAAADTYSWITITTGG